MMKSLAIAALLGATAITGTVALNAQDRPAAANGPTYGRFGFDEKGMDKSVRPGDDFYGFANGEWAKTTAIPADKSSYGAFDKLADLSRERTHTILEQAKGQGNQIGTAYATYLDTATIEAKGLAPIQPWLSRIKGLNDKSGYAALLAEADRNGVGIPFGSGVGQDARQPNLYTVGLRQSGLGMPDRDYYLSDDPKLTAARAAYQAHLAKMLTMAGEADAEARAQAIVAFETQIAKVH
ncbi:M13 family metallopeptidase N-terminal domain-containing protein, partial [Sphingomonas sp. RB1R13]